MTLVGFIPGPSCVVATSPDDQPTRWCFHCRKHLSHSWALMDDPPERQPSYYEPVPVLRCSRCHHDHASFPGSDIDGPRYPSEGIWKDLVEQAQKTRESWDWEVIWTRDRERTSHAFSGERGDA